MGDLTDDITRLCVEIETLRDSRKVFGSQLDKETREMKTGVSKMREGFGNVPTSLTRNGVCQ
jgi:hypothetical protein